MLCSILCFKELNMARGFAESEHKTLEHLNFELYLRTGLRLSPAALQALAEQKFNPYRDPDDGRFTFGQGGRSLPPRHERTNMGMIPKFGPARPSARQKPQTPRPHPSPARRAKRGDPGALSAKYESGGSGDPGAVSSGANDPGGVSYGKHQYSSKTGTTAKFVASPEARRWANDFQGLTPGTPQFSAKWRQVASRDPAALGAAQDAYTYRTHYDAAVNGVLRSTGLNLDGGSEAIRQVAYSVAVQHGGAAIILRDSITRTDKRLRRSDHEYQAALINAIYDRRIEYVRRVRDQALAEKRPADARGLNNSIVNRYPNERVDALRLLTVP
jgi:hypothetical protein